MSVRHFIGRKILEDQMHKQYAWAWLLPFMSAAVRCQFAQVQSLIEQETRHA